MKNYSAQLDKFIKSKHYANSFYKNNDGRTCVAYYLDDNGLIHSNSFNYSIIRNNPISVEDFKNYILKDDQVKVSFV